MFAWGTGILVILAVVLVIAHRRSARRRGHTTGQGLFEDLLPSAITGSTSSPGPRDGWELRWADVTSLTAVDSAGRSHRVPAHAIRSIAGEEAVALPVADSTTKETVGSPVS